MTLGPLRTLGRDCDRAGGDPAHRRGAPGAGDVGALIAITAMRASALLADGLLRCPSTAAQLDDRLGTRLWRRVAGEVVQSAACAAGRRAGTCGRDGVGLAVLGALVGSLRP